MQADRLRGDIAEVGGRHVVGHLQINHRSAILSPPDLAERLGAVGIGVEKTQTAGTRGPTAGGSSSCLTLAHFQNCSLSPCDISVAVLLRVLAQCGNLAPLFG